MTQETIHVFLRTACLRLQLCHYRIQIAFGWNWLLRVEMQSGMVDDRVEFLVGELWGGYAALLKKCFFRPAMFFAFCLSMPHPIFAATLAFLPFSGTRRSRVSKLWWSRAEPVERNAWDVLPRRCRAKVSPAAGPHIVATLSVTCLFARDVLDGPRENQVVHVFDWRTLTPYWQEQLLLLTAGGPRQDSDCPNNVHRFCCEAVTCQLASWHRFIMPACRTSNFWIYKDSGVDAFHRTQKHWKYRRCSITHISQKENTLQNKRRCVVWTFFTSPPPPKNCFWKTTTKLWTV